MLHHHHHLPASSSSSSRRSSRRHQRQHGAGSRAVAAQVASTTQQQETPQQQQHVGSPGLKLGAELRPQFPILHQEVNGRPLVYLDNAATSQKPQAVLDALHQYYSRYNSNVHRGVHTLSAKATHEYEAARDKLARFLGAPSHREVVFTRNASEAINLVAYSWGLANLKAGDEVILSVAEHHSNLVPWQLVAQRTGAVLRHVRLTPDQQLDMQHLKELLSARTKLVSLVHVSNVLGAVLDTSYVVEEAHKVGARVLLDCCQSVPHIPVDVRRLGADWIVGSSHKMCGPTGMGFLWGRYDVLEGMQPWMGGGEMIQDVFLERSTYAPPPARFEAGTPAIGEAIGYGAAVDFLTGLGMDRVHQFEEELGGYLYQELSRVPGVTIYGPSPQQAGGRGRASLAAFNVEGLHATDVSTLLDTAGVAVRSGHHCTQPLHQYLGINASARASAYIYNTPQEVDAFVEALTDTIKFFKEL